MRPWAAPPTQLVKLGKLDAVRVVLVVLLEHLEDFRLFVLKAKGAEGNLQRGTV